MSDPRRPSLLPPSGYSAAPLGGILGLIVAWIGWMLVALVGLVFIVSVLIWLALLIAFSLIRGWITGRPSMVALLWRHYRDVMRGRWPQTPGAKRSTTPRADAVRAASADDSVQDVNWRDVTDKKDR